MDINFLLLLMLGTIKDPILWILACIIGSNILANSISIKIMYLFISGFILGFIRLNIYKSFGESFTSGQTLLLIIISILFMISLGTLFYITFKLIRTKS